MAETLLKTKLYIPPRRADLVPRPRLMARLDAGLRREQRLTLVSAPAGFGKTTLVTQWLAATEQRTAWLSLDAEDSDPARFLTYLIAALQTVAPAVGAGLLATLQSPQPPPLESLLTPLLNEIAAIDEPFTLVLDDYHEVDAAPVDQALTRLLTHLPPHAHVLITTREDPQLPLSRLRARGQLTELRAADLRFTAGEAARFLNQVMGLDLTPDAVDALETRTEGWIAGLQLAALSMRGQEDIAGFIQSFTGSHRFVLDYLAEEVLARQPEPIHDFLLRTAILERLCGPLCDALLDNAPGTGQKTLEYLEQANLFLTPLDDRRRWYRYHHLFADLLRQRFQQEVETDPAFPAEETAALHLRASRWYEEHGLTLEAFRHAADAGDVARAARLIESESVPLHYRGAAAPVLKWLASLPDSVLDTQPSLRVTYAAALWVAGRVSAVEPALHAAESAMQNAASPPQNRDLVGQIAALRAALAALQRNVDTMLAQAQRALQFLDPDNLSARTTATWILALAHQFLRERDTAMEIYRDVIAMSEASGNTLAAILATTGLGIIQESQNQLHPAADTYRRVLEIGGEPAPPSLCEAYLGLGRLYYQWNEFEKAGDHLDESSRLAAHIENIDGRVACDVARARILLARGDLAGAETVLTEAGATARRQNFVRQIPAIAAARVRLLLRRGNAMAAAQVADTHQLPFSQARVHLARGNGTAALAVLQPARAEAEANGWNDEWLEALLLEALACATAGDREEALTLLGKALAAAEPGGFIRLFVDEGEPMADLLAAAARRGMAPEYTGRLLAAFDRLPAASPASAVQPLIEPLSDRELEVLGLVSQGLSNRQIAERLYLALSTVKGHNRRIYAKLQVNRRTEAVARARELNLL